MRHFQLTTLCILFLAINSCKKEKKETEVTNNTNITATPDPYSRPWNVKYLTYENSTTMCGNHTNGYRLYYKDRLIRKECREDGYLNLQNPLYINDTTMMYFKPTSNSALVLQTSDGGYSWSEATAGRVTFSKFHLVKASLVYCVTKDKSYNYITGIGKSDLFLYLVPGSAGRHHVYDLKAEITDLDSTVITLNDSVSAVILFK